MDGGASDSRSGGTSLVLADAGRFGFWVNGRAGVLGEVDSAVAAAAIGFMAPHAVHDYWQRSPRVRFRPGTQPWHGLAAPPHGVERHLSPWPTSDVRRLADLARKVIDQADLSIGTLFAGSARIPTPGDAAGDAAINLNVLREFRGCAHLAACHAAGLGPHATIMSTDDPVRGGASWAEGFGWTSPHPQPDIQARARVEELTTAAAARSFESLEKTERADFVHLVTAARACID